LEDLCCAVAVMVCLRSSVHFLNRMRQGVAFHVSYSSLDLNRLSRLFSTQSTKIKICFDGSCLWSNG
jgi:hypothetical protein